MKSKTVFVVVIVMLFACTPELPSEPASPVSPLAVPTDVAVSEAFTFGEVSLWWDEYVAVTCADYSIVEMGVSWRLKQQPSGEVVWRGYEVVPEEAPGEVGEGQFDGIISLQASLELSPGVYSVWVLPVWTMGPDNCILEDGTPVEMYAGRHEPCVLVDDDGYCQLAELMLPHRVYLPLWSKGL